MPLTLPSDRSWSSRGLLSASGIPQVPTVSFYSLWKGIGEAGRTVLHGCLIALMVDGSADRLAEEFGSFDDCFDRCDFNASLLVPLTKKPVRVDPEMGQVYQPEDTRPLMLVDTSNRTLARSPRLKIEPAVEELVNDCQRGFLHGRSILANIVELGAIMQEAVLGWSRPTAWFCDMRAAFPSIEHDFLHKMLELCRLPLPLRTAIRALYADQCCCLTMHGDPGTSGRARAGRPAAGDRVP
ncbi:unnamed protein product [Prorocentrum cordatum]|uniref:Reverse transcriptase domain-containing protein n=2 Tax=Prorocentrum cordatum TaxID=2364126 RepID=A0ABN9W4S0_9DINO|nr:unnamed protein product [Polarella glacialis]